MSKVLATYSGKDTNLSIAAPLVGPIMAAGVSGNGLAEATIRMTEPRSSLQVGMDGAVVPSVMPGDNGEIELQVWQTSTLHADLLAWFNAIKAAYDAGDASEWFGARVIIENSVTGRRHIATGVAPSKHPDVSYQAQAGKITWTLVACNISNE